MGDDTAGRRRAPLDEALRASDEILELLPVATYVCDPEGRIVRYNRRVVELWGREPKPGDTHEHFTAQSKFYSADGQQLPHSRLKEVLTTGKAARDEEIMVERSDGTRLAMLLNIDPLFDAQGNLIGVINCAQDITERKRVHEALESSRLHLRQQEERWQATYEHAAIGIVEVDADGRFLRVNEAICKISGFSREELLGLKLFIRTHPEDGSADEELYRRQVSGEFSFYSIEKRYIRKDGRVIWCAIRSSTVRDADGKFLYSVRVVQDINERKEAEERQKLLIDELNHRVKNTLATVQSLAMQTSRGTASVDEFRQAFDGRLIALSYAHDQLTRRHWKSADLFDIVKSVTSPYTSQARDQIEIAGERIVLNPRAGLTLALAFHELTTNAAKYGALSSPSGRIEVHWRIVREPSKPPRLWIGWREYGGPPVVAPARTGFGSRFIAGSVAAELQGVARLAFEAEGLRCTIEIPVDDDLQDRLVESEKQEF
jgi:PAS domain S-box-containing protein